MSTCGGREEVEDVCDGWLFLSCSSPTSLSTALFMNFLNCPPALPMKKSKSFDVDRPWLPLCFELTAITSRTGKPNTFLTRMSSSRMSFCIFWPGFFSSFAQLAIACPMFSKRAMLSFSLPLSASAAAILYLTGTKLRPSSSPKYCITHLHSASPMSRAKTVLKGSVELSFALKADREERISSRFSSEAMTPFLAVVSERRMHKSAIASQKRATLRFPPFRLSFSARPLR
mmetsp:Transcript_29296/g.75499  ORF Transcript_29296/g.75499 Transcript_29296/m.75499 type:complete len:230 (-) Transcript_29296:1144-1833(-)